MGENVANTSLGAMGELINVQGTPTPWQLTKSAVSWTLCLAHTAILIGGNPAVLTDDSNPREAWL